MKKILFILSMLFIALISIKAQSYTMQKNDCNITFTNISTNKIWYSFDLYQAVINYNPTNDVNQFSIGDNLRTNIFSKSQIINFASIPIIIDSFYSWKTDCIDLHKGSGGSIDTSNNLKLYSENYNNATFIPQSATGSNSIAMGGSNAQANGDFSIAWGQESVSNGVLSMAFGENCSSFGETSISLGKSCLSNGNASISMGYGAMSKSYSETALGTQNTDYMPISPTSFQLTDRLLVVGNGDLTQSDAFTILKNAKTGIDIDSFEQTTSLAKLQVNGLISANIQTIDVTNLDLNENNITQTILVDNSNNGVYITLPDPTISYYNGMSIRLTIKLITNNIINTIRVFPYGSEKIDNQDSFTFTKSYQSIDLVTDGTNWWIVSNNN